MDSLKGQPLYFSLMSITTPSIVQGIQGIWLLTVLGCQREFLPAGRVQAASAQRWSALQETRGAGRVGREKKTQEAKSTLCKERIEFSGVADILLKESQNRGISWIGREPQGSSTPAPAPALRAELSWSSALDPSSPWAMPCCLLHPQDTC